MGDKIAIIQPNRPIRRRKSLFKTEHVKWRKVVYNNSTPPPYAFPRTGGPERRAQHCGCHRFVVLDHWHASEI
jgi:hypothetical protein